MNYNVEKITHSTLPNTDSQTSKSVRGELIHDYTCSVEQKYEMKFDFFVDLPLTLSLH